MCLANTHGSFCAVAFVDFELLALGKSMVVKYRSSFVTLLAYLNMEHRHLLPSVAKVSDFLNPTVVSSLYVIRIGFDRYGEFW
jgi:hypothetical protein